MIARVTNTRTHQDGSRRRYVLNGLATFILLIALFNGFAMAEFFDPAVIVDRYFQIFAVVNLWALALSIHLFFSPRKPEPCGNVLLDFWEGGFSICCFGWIGLH